MCSFEFWISKVFLDDRTVISNIRAKAGFFTMQMAILLYLFYMSKYVEFMDTVRTILSRQMQLKLSNSACAVG